MCALTKVFLSFFVCASFFFCTRARRPFRSRDCEHRGDITDECHGHGYGVLSCCRPKRTPIAVTPKGVLLLNAETKAFMALARRPRGVFFVSFSRVSFIVSGVVRDLTVLAVCIKRRRKKTLSRARYLHFRDRRGGSQTCTQLRAQIRAESVSPLFSPHIPSGFRGAPNSSEIIVGSHAFSRVLGPNLAT